MMTHWRISSKGRLEKEAVCARVAVAPERANHGGRMDKTISSAAQPQHKSKHDRRDQHNGVSSAKAAVRGSEARDERCQDAAREQHSQSDGHIVEECSSASAVKCVPTKQAALAGNARTRHGVNPR